MEATSACQLKCPACPTASGSAVPVVGRGHLSFADFRRLLDNNPEIAEIELSNYGEMFLNPELLDILAYAHRKGVALTADNGVNLNTVRPEVLEGLVSYRFRRLTCSIDGATSATYARYRVGGDFNAVMRNVRQLNALKRAHKSRYPVLKWQFVRFRHNLHELGQARRLADQLGMRFEAKLSWNEDGPGGGLPESRRAYRERYGVEYMRAICGELWVKPQVNWDGRVLGCCRNFWGEFGGNAFTDGVRRVSNGERISYARGMLQGRNPRREDVPCSTCEQYLSMSSGGRWLTPYEVRIPACWQRWLYEHGLAGPAVFSLLAGLAEAAALVRRAGRSIRRVAGIRAGSRGD